MKTSTVVLVALAIAGIVINVLGMAGGLPGWMVGQVPMDELQTWQKLALPVTLIVGRLGGLGALVLIYFAFVRK